jgi:hypothetical protein
MGILESMNLMHTYLSHIDNSPMSNTTLDAESLLEHTYAAAGKLETSAAHRRRLRFLSRNFSVIDAV